MTKALTDQIPSSITDNYIRDVFTDRLHHDDTRKYVTGVVNDYAKTVDFMELVRKYAGQEMDSRLFHSTQYWVTTVVTALITSGLGFLLATIFK